MTPEDARKLEILESKLHDHLMTAAMCAKEMCTVARTRYQIPPRNELSHAGNGHAPRTTSHQQRPVLDEGSFSVLWKGKMLHLGNTLAFRLLVRLSRRPDQYVTHRDLRRDVWNKEYLETSSIRSFMRRLPSKQMTEVCSTPLRGSSAIGATHWSRRDSTLTTFSAKHPGEQEQDPSPPKWFYSQPPCRQRHPHKAQNTHEIP